MEKMEQQQCDVIDKLSVAIKYMQKCLECSICLHTIFSPVKTRCGHSFCHACIAKVLRKKKAQCPLCNSALTRRSISKDEHMEMCIVKLEKLIDAIRTDSGIDILSHVVRVQDTKEGCSSDTTYCSQSEEFLGRLQREKAKTTLPKPTNNLQPTDEPRDASKLSRKTFQDPKKEDQGRGVFAFARDHSSKEPLHYGISGVEPLVSQESEARKKSTEGKVQCWLKGLPDGVEMNQPGPSVELMDCSLDDTVIESISRAQSDNTDSEPEGVTWRLRAEDEARNRSLEGESRATKERRKLRESLESRDKGSSSKEMKSEEKTTELKFKAVHARVRDKCAGSQRKNSQNSLESEGAKKKEETERSETTLKNWNSVVQFGKEMRSRRKKLRSLNVSIEGRNGSRMSGEALRRRRSAERRREEANVGESRKEQDESGANTLGAENRRRREEEERPSMEWTSTEAVRDPDLTMSSRKASSIRATRGSTDTFLSALERDSQVQRSSNSGQSGVHANIMRNREEFGSSRKDSPIKLATSAISVKDSETQMENLHGDLTNENRNDIVRIGETTKSPRNVSLVEGSQTTTDAFITFEEGDQVRIKNLNSAQMNDIIGIFSGNASSQSSEKKILSLRRHSNSPRTLCRDIEPSPPLVAFEDCLSASKSQSSNVARTSTPLQARLSLRKNQTSSGQKHGTSTTMENARLASAKRDLTEEMNKDTRRVEKEIAQPSTSREKELQENRRISTSANLIEHRDNVPEEGGRSNCSVLFKKLGRIFKKRESACKFLYLGTTRERGSIREEMRMIEAIRRMEVSREIDRAISRVERDKPSTAGTRRSMDTSNTTSGNTVKNIGPVNRTKEMSMDTEENNIVTKSSDFAQPRERTAIKHVDLQEKSGLQKATTSFINPMHKPATSNDDLQTLSKDQGSPQRSKSEKANRQGQSPKNTEELESIDRRATTSKKQQIPKPSKLLSPEKDSQLKFLSLESPLSESLRASKRDDSFREAGFSELKGVHSRALLLESQNSNTKPQDPPGTPCRKRKRTISVTRERLSDKVEAQPRQVEKDSTEDSNDSTTSFFSKATIIRKRSTGLDEPEDARKRASTSKLEEQRPVPLAEQATQEIQVIFVSEDANEEECEEAKPRIYKRIRKSSSSSEVETIDDCKASGSKAIDPGIQELKDDESSKRKRQLLNSDDLKAILSSWRTDMTGPQRSFKREKLEPQVPSNPTRSASRLQRDKMTWISKQTLLNSANRSTVVSRDAESVEVDMFDSENIYEAGHEVNPGSSRARKPAEEDYFHDIIDRVKEIQMAQDADRSTGVEEEVASRRLKDESLMQDNFDEVIANVDTQALLFNYGKEVTPVEANLQKPKSTDDGTINQRESKRVSRDETSSCKTKSSNFKDGPSKTSKSFRMEKAVEIYPSNISRSSDKENEAAYRGTSEFQNVDPETSDKSLTPDGLDTMDERRVARKGGLRRNYESPRSFVGQEENRRPFEACKEMAVEDSGPKDSYSEQDSLMNVTQQQLLLKQVEEDLFGRNRDLVNDETSRRQENEYTPVKCKRREGRIERNRHKGEEHSGEEDDIVESTPDTKVKNSGPQSRPTLQNPAISEAPATTTPPSHPARSSTSTPINFLHHPLHQSTPKVLRGPNGSPRATGRRAQQVKEGPVGEASPAAHPDKLCFACSGLSRGEVERVRELARILQADFTSKFARDVSHVIVRAEEDNTATKTLKYLQGIAHRKWVLSYAWVLGCFKERRLIREDPYEAVDPVTLEPGPRKARQGEKPPFLGFAFLCVGPYKDVTVADYVDLLLATGAVVVKSIEALQAERDKIKVIAVQPCMHDKHIIGWHQKTRAIIVADEWIIECISQYRLVSMRTFLQELVPQDVIDLGYPELVETDGDLVDENEIRMSSDEEDDATVAPGFKWTKEMF